MSLSMTVPQMARRQARVHGHLVTFQQQHHDLLVLLLLRRGQWVGRNEIIEWLWPDPDEEGEWPRNHVNVLVCKLRKVLGRDAILNHYGLGHMVPKQ